MTKQRLRLLQRERERQSMRWQQFDALISGGAPMPEPGFALALYYRVAQDAGGGKESRRLGAWREAKDLRQMALVFDWCGSGDDQGAERTSWGRRSRQLWQRQHLARRAGTQRRVLAAIAIADRLPDHGEAELHANVEKWWRGTVVKRIKDGRPIPREQLYWLYEMFHAVRDNLKIDLRESAPEYFKSLPVDHLAESLSGSLWPPKTNTASRSMLRDGEPDINDLVMSRAAELAMVAYDDNALKASICKAG